MKTILITGANRGLGLEMVKQYAEDGWQIYACCRAPTKSRALLALKEKFPRSIVSFKLDVTSTYDIQAIKETLKNKPIDVLMNNAGILASHSFGTLDLEQWLESFKINTIAPAMMAQAFIENVAASSMKLIANISSVWGSIASNYEGGQYSYRSSKAALNAVVKSLSIDLKTRGVIVVAINPGWVKTDMGGTSATLTPAKSIQGIRQILASLSLRDSGSFIQYDGKKLSW